MKLIQIEDYLLLIEEEAEIKEGNIAIYDFGMGYELEIPCNKDNLKSNTRKLVIAYYPLTKEAKELDLPKLPPFEVDIEKLAEDRYGKYEASIDIPNKYLREGFIDGYKAAQSLNKQISLEDMIAFGKKCFYKGFEKAENDDANSFTAWREECYKLIQSTNTQQLPVSFEPEYEITYKEYKNGKKELISVEFHKISDSEGKEFLVGTYKY